MGGKLEGIILMRLRHLGEGNIYFEIVLFGKEWEEFFNIEWVENTNRVRDVY